MQVIDTPDVSILHYLHRIGAADDGHVSAAMTYLDWQAAFQSMTGYRSMALGRSGNLRTDGDTAQSKSDCWMRLILQPPAEGQKDYRLPPHYQSAIEAVTTIRRIPKEMQKAIKEQKDDYVRPLDRLGYLISGINHFLVESYKNPMYY